MKSKTLSSENAALSRKRALRSLKKNLVSYSFLLPFIVGTLIFTLYPIVMSLLYALSNFNGTRITQIGFFNFGYIFDFSEFGWGRRVFGSLGVTFLYVIGNMTLSLVLSYLLALFLLAAIVGRYIRPIRRLAIELEINQRHGDEERAADAAGKAALRRRVTAELYAKRCRQAQELARRKLIVRLGDEVKGPLPRQLLAENYFAEQRRFHLSLQAQKLSFDQFLAARGQTVEQLRAELHADAERKLRSRLGLLLVAEREHLWPGAAETDAALAAWDDKRDGQRTFPANDARKARQRLASARAEGFILARSTLIPPPEEPVVEG